METGDLAATRGSNLPQNSGQQPVIVVVQAPPTNKQQCDEERYQKLLPKKTIMGMSVFMVVAGILSIIIQVKRPKVSLIRNEKGAFLSTWLLILPSALLT